MDIIARSDFINFFSVIVFVFALLVCNLTLSLGICFLPFVRSVLYILVYVILARGPSDEGCATRHRLKRDPLPPNDLDKIAQNVRERKRRKEINKEDLCLAIFL